MNIQCITKKLINERPGIYLIRNIITDFVYIGSSKNVYHRLMTHKSELLNNKHDNTHLQRSFNKHGCKNFSVELLEYCDDLISKETFYLAQYTNCYNTRIVCDNNSGLLLSESHKQKISKSLKGKIPQNLNDNQRNRKRKIIMYKSGIKYRVFDSCKSAAEYIGMKPNAFSQYIGKQLKSKYYDNNITFDYET